MSAKDMPLATPQTASHPAPTSEALGLPWEASEDGVVIRAIDSNVMGNIVCLQPGFERSFMRWPDRRDFIVQACNSHAALVKALEGLIPSVEWSLGNAPDRTPTMAETRRHLDRAKSVVASAQGDANGEHVRTAGTVTDIVSILERGLALKGGWREAIVELEDHCSEPVRLRNMLAAADQLDDWAVSVRAALARAKGEE